MISEKKKKLLKQLSRQVDLRQTEIRFILIRRKR